MLRAIVALRRWHDAGTFPPGSFFSISLPSLSRSLRSARAASAPAASPLASASWTAFQRLYSSLTLRHDKETSCVRVACRSCSSTSHVQDIMLKAEQTGFIQGAA